MSQEAGRWEELLGVDVAKARDSLDQWHSLTSSEAKLARVLREGSGTAALGRYVLSEPQSDRAETSVHTCTLCPHLVTGIVKPCVERGCSP